MKKLGTRKLKKPEILDLVKEVNGAAGGKYQDKEDAEYGPIKVGVMVDAVCFLSALIYGIDQKQKSKDKTR